MPVELVILLVAVALVVGIVVWRVRARPAELPGRDASALGPSASPTESAAVATPRAKPSEVEAPPPSRATPERDAVPQPAARPSTRVEAERHQAREDDRERIRRGLEKTRGGFVAKLARIFRGKPKVDAALRDDIEEVLFTADIGTAAATALMQRLGDVLDRQQVSDADAVWAVLEQAALDVVKLPAPPTDFAPPIRPYVLLMIGVNGVGKTTTLGKLAAQHVRAGRRVLLVAGDTFRAGATEQLEVWAQRVGCDIHVGDEKADPSSVVYEGIARGRREGHDVVLCDTAGRLHTRKELMDELGKVRRAAAKAIAHDRPQDERDAITGPHDTYLVLDATIGQNALAQAKLFKETTDFTGLVITKLDGTAKGGVVLGVCEELRVPIRYVGVGEGIDDLRTFDAEDFVAALFSDRDRGVDGSAAPPTPASGATG